jgi:hypothetical protein
LVAELTKHIALRVAMKLAMLTSNMLFPLLMLLASAQGGQHYKNEIKKPARKVLR